MSFAVAVPCALAAAVAYGASTAVQQSAAHLGTGRADARRLVGLLRDPRWLLSVGGDGLGLALQAVALATGPVVLIQPLLVLALPVSLPVAHRLGGRRPDRADALGCLAVLGGLAVFFALLGDPGRGRTPTTTATWTTLAVALVVAGLVVGGLRRAGPVVRAAGYGAVAGGLFGAAGVLLNGAAEAWSAAGLSGVTHGAGLACALGCVVAGAVGMTLTQLSFQVGALAAAFPANESAAPIVAVVLGALLLHERVPGGPLRGLAYLACAAAVVAGTVLLARSTPASR